MLELLTQAAAQVPSLVVLCVLVHIENQRIILLAIESLNHNTEMRRPHLRHHRTD